MATAQPAKPTPGSDATPSVISGTPSNLPCITDPMEYAKAFAAREARCTQGLLVRLGGVAAATVPSNWFDAVKAKSTSPPTPWVEAESRLRTGFINRIVNFMGAGDQPMKYLAIGNPTAPKGSISTIPNGLAFLEQVGYQLSEADVTRIGLVMVMRDPNVLATSSKYKKGFYGKIKLNGTLMDVKSTATLPKKNNKKWDGALTPWPKTFVPTWDAVMTYLRAYMLETLSFDMGQDMTAAVAAVLKAKTFQELTGCGALCVFEDRAFPDPTGSTNFPPANTPVIVGTRGADGSCTLTDGYYPAGTRTNATVPNPDVPGSAPVPRFRVFPSDAAGPLSPSCSDAFKSYNTLFVINGSCSFEPSGRQDDMLNRFVQHWTASADATDKAILVKAALQAGCLGGFNALFAGNGLTYTGTGGFFAPLGQEVLLEQLTPVKPFLPVKAGNGNLTASCNGTASPSNCSGGLPYVGQSCVASYALPAPNASFALPTTDEGLLCDSKLGMGAVFMPICFNGNLPNLNSSSYPNADPNYACNPLGRSCTNGAMCCSAHCVKLDSPTGLTAYDPAGCGGPSKAVGCTAGNCRACRYAGDTTPAVQTLPVCPACKCNGKDVAQCTADGW